MSEWESKRWSNKKFRPPYTRNEFFSLNLQWNKYGIKSRLERSPLKKEDTTPLTPNNTVNLCIIYELDLWPSDLSNEFTLDGCLFGCFELKKNYGPDKCSYSGYGIGFNPHGFHYLPDGSVGKSVITFGVDMSSFMYIDNEGKDI